jgi:hypothetical protein
MEVSLAEVDTSQLKIVSQSDALRDVWVSHVVSRSPRQASFLLSSVMDATNRRDQSEILEHSHPKTVLQARQARRQRAAQSQYRFAIKGAASYARLCVEHGLIFNALE